MQQRLHERGSSIIQRCGTVLRKVNTWHRIYDCRLPLGAQYSVLLYFGKVVLARYRSARVVWVIVVRCGTVNPIWPPRRHRRSRSCFCCFRSPVRSDGSMKPLPWPLPPPPPPAAISQCQKLASADGQFPPDLPPAFAACWQDWTRLPAPPTPAGWSGKIRWAS